MKQHTQKSEQIYDGITDIRDDIVEQAQPRAPEKGKSRRKWPIAAAAAVLAVVLAGTAILWPGGSPIVPSAYAIAEAKYPEMAPYPDASVFFNENSSDYEGYNQAYDAWRESRYALATNTDWPTELEHFLTASIAEFLTDAETDNRVYSPVNVYMALAMLAELTDGNSRQQILDLLNAESIQSLRSTAAALWGGCYVNDGAVTSILANSLWLNQDVDFVQSTMDTLADTYYTSSYQGEMGSDDFNKALQDWLNKQTGDLLEEQASQLAMEPNTILALASTVFFKAKWDYEFSPDSTQEDVFHAAAGDITCDFMHQKSLNAYCWGDQFTAISRSFEDAGSMWFLLPDEGVSPDGLLHDGQVMQFLLNPAGWENCEYVMVNQTIPKFDVSSNLDLIDDLQKLGVTDVFDLEASDFSPMTQDTDEICLSKAEHAARVTIDEEGCTAAAYTVMMLIGNDAPTGEEIDFVLNRPFLFAITSQNGLPLFIGVVNCPV